MPRHKHSRILLPDADIPRPAHPAVGPLVFFCSIVAFMATFRELYIIFFNPHTFSGPLTKSFSFHRCFSSQLIPEPANIVVSSAKRVQCFVTELSQDQYTVWLIISSLLACLLLRLDELSRQELVQTPTTKQKKRKAHRSSSLNATKRRKTITRDISQESLRRCLSPIREINEIETSSSLLGASTLYPPKVVQGDQVDCSGYPPPDLGDFYMLFDENNLLEINDPYEDPELVIILKRADL